MSEGVRLTGVGTSGRPIVQSGRLEPLDRARLAADFVGVALIALYVGMFAIRNTLMQGDLRTYLAAARAALQGIDPYPPEHLTTLARRATLPFVYPPITLPAFFPLLALPHRLVLTLWMGANVALLAGLVVAWRRWPFAHIGLLPLALVAVFGWNSSALSGLRSGNIALFEAAVLWAALMAYARGRRILFAVLIVAAACFKVMPAAFLLLLLVPTQRDLPRPGVLMASLVALAGLIMAPVALGPASRWEFFMRHLPRAETMGFSNPGALGFTTALAQSCGLSDAYSRSVGLGAWLALVVMLIAISIPFLRGTLRSRGGGPLPMAALFLIILLGPRPMAYGFVLLTPAALFFSPKPFAGSTGALILTLALSAEGLTAALKHGSDSVVYVYAPFLLALCLWLLIVRPGSPVTSDPARIPSQAFTAPPHSA